MITYELNEIISCAKALKRINCDMPLRATLARAMQSRLKRVWRSCGLEWNENEVRIVWVSRPDCKGVKIEMPVQQRYTIEEAEMLAAAFRKAAKDAVLPPKDADCDTE